MMNSNQFHDLFGSQWPPDQHGGHSSASTMLHQSQGLPPGMQLKREPHTDGQPVMHNQMGMDITSGSVADSTSPPPGSSDGMFGSSISGMFMDKKAANSIRGAQFKCPNKDGQYEDPVQCDKFYECVDGVATTKLCPDGLVFDPTIRKINKCDQPFNVDCGDRSELQPAKPNEFCPRRNGFFAHPDPSVCNIFFNCIEGESTEVKCTAGLHFDEYSGTCVWPDSAGRQGCQAQDKKLKDGFECPASPKLDAQGQIVAHPKFAHPSDCQRFYVCLNGVEPRDLGCQAGEVYNEETERCDAPENVRGCEDWYKDSEDAPAPKARS